MRKPEVTIPEEHPPTELLKVDETVGDGDEATSGSNVTVHYVGVSWSTGEQFDASWDRMEPFAFGLGRGQVIQGWDDGVQGMKVGGRRRADDPTAPGLRRIWRRRRDRSPRNARLRGRSPRRQLTT